MLQNAKVTVSFTVSQLLRVNHHNNKVAAIDLYLSSLEHLKVEVPKDKFKNLTTSERNASYDLKKYTLLISAVMVSNNFSWQEDTVLNWCNRK